MNMFSPSLVGTITAVVLWEVVWKCLALWQAAKRDHKVLFVLLLVLNTAGVFPIGFLLYIKLIEDKK